MTSEAEELACRCENHANQCHDAQLAWVLPARLKAAAAMIRRLEKDRDEARNKALDEAAKAALAAWEEYPDDGDYIVNAILALKTQEPSP